MTGSEALLGTADVARRLGVKPGTVYAYVSRGLLERHPASTRRGSLFEPEAVERAAGRARRPNRSGALELVIETQLTCLDPTGRLHYRGRDATELARYRSFEDVVGLLWDGDPYAPWALCSEDLALVESVTAALPPASRGTVDALAVVVAALGAADPDRGDRRPDAVRRAGARIQAGVLATLTGAAKPKRNPSAAASLWRAFDRDGRRPRPAQTSALNAALVLLADHELAASTLAARVAASAWADPYRVVLAGLGTLGGALHGGASLASTALLAEIDTPARAFSVLERHIAAGGSIAGFGHRVYRGRDPRADQLLTRLADVTDDPERRAAVQAVLEAAPLLGLPAPNVDFALAALVSVMTLRPDAGPILFTVARIPGLIAHAIEEYPHRLRFRPRASYVGPPV